LYKIRDMKRKIFVTLLIGFLSQISIAQDLDKAKLDNYFNALEANSKFMGSVAVSQNGKIIYKKSVGFSDFENNIKADGNTKYRIGSISKTFTSVLVLKAIEEKKITLNQSIDKFFPTVKNADKITVKHLLSHRSGIHSFTNDEDYLTWNTQPKTENEMVKIIADRGSDFEPDSKAEYSNSNFVLLTYILEKTFRKSYADLISTYIAKPLKLTNTYLGNKINTNKNESNSYRYTGSWNIESETDMSIPLGAGGIISTPADLVKFSDALFSGKLLKKESLDLMNTFNDNYGFGLFQIPFYDKKGFGHSGGIDGFSSIFSYFPEGKVSYAMTSNGTNFDSNNISIAVLSAVFNKPYDIPEFSVSTIKAEDLDKYLGVYSSPQIPLKIKITKENNSLFAQATGQPSFMLETSGKDTFKFDQAGVVLEFNPTKSSMVLKQGGGQFTFTKE
jgi:D-alanyl-D-alanine carboxypeptidase